MKNIGSILTGVVVISLTLRSASAFATGVAHHIRLEYSKPNAAHRHHNRVPAVGRIQEQKRSSTTTTVYAASDSETTSQTPLCDLQTFLRLCNLVQSGGEAKNAIQNSECLLNNAVETRRGKKLYPGDKVTFGDVKNLDVATEVEKKGYVYKPKVKKVKPLPKVDVDVDGNLSLGGGIVVKNGGQKGS
jgi:ribosome-associated protein